MPNKKPDHQPTQQENPCASLITPKVTASPVAAALRILPPIRWRRTPNSKPGLKNTWESPSKHNTLAGPSLMRSCCHHTNPHSHPHPWPSPPRVPTLPPFPPAPGTMTTIGKFAALFARQISNWGWRTFVHSRRSTSDINPAVATLAHPAARLLNHLRLRGAPVVLQPPPPPLSPTQHAILMSRGPHKSAFDHLAFLSQEFQGMITQGFGVVIPYTNWCHWKNLLYVLFLLDSCIRISW